MSPRAAKILRFAGWTAAALVVVAGATAGWFHSRLRASLPQLDGAAAIPGLAAPVTVTRDALGVPTIRGAHRADVARGLGFLHAQDRFFQMDLLRRDSAGELSALFGARALPRDKANRLHGFRALAVQVLARLPAPERTVLDAYTAGVNTGLNALGAKPFEYYATRTTPRPWQPEDTLLVYYTMSLDLQDETGVYERSLMTIRDQLGPEGLAFFAPLQTPDDAALDGSTAPVAPIPSPRTLDLRPTKVTGGAIPRRPLDLSPALDGRPVRPSFPFPALEPEAILGSNAFSLSGAHTASGAGLIAVDIHLGLSVPNIWYRTSLEFPDHRITGASLPGTPLVVAGSNGKIAWGFTVSYTDTGDVVVIEPAAGLTGWYIVPGGDAQKMETRTEVIEVKGSKPVSVDYAWTIWGPIVGRNEKGRALAYKWVGHDPAAINLGLIDLEAAADVASAVQVAHRAAVPSLNFLVADSAGATAWTLGGRLPKRVNYDGRLPVPMAYGDRRWEGLLPYDEVPVVASAGSGIVSASVAPDGRIWSANSRQIGGAALAKLGDGGYGRPNRAAQIRDQLAVLEKARPADLLTLLLDDRALFLAPWQKLFLETLTPEAIAAQPARRKLREWAEKWEGRASTEAVSYPVVRQFRTAVYQRVFQPIFAASVEAAPDFNWRQLRLEPALWTLLRQKPAHLLNPEFKSWEELLVAAADDVTAHFAEANGAPLGTNWGQINRARIRHPFGTMLPRWLAGWLNLPEEPLPGDTDMPRVQTPRLGASVRFAVSPGREAEGCFHMPGGQSGHPLSPYYRAGHDAWVRGEPTPFLPGPTQHTLQLTP